MTSTQIEKGWTIRQAQWHALPHPLRDIFTNIDLIVYDTLDIERMKSSLLQLANEWPLLAARLRRNKGRNIDILMPNTPLLSEAKVEWISFKVEYIKEEIPQHNWQTLKSTSQPESWIIEDNTIPESLHNYFKLGKNQPTMYVRVKQYRNAAVVKVTLPHLLYDIFGTVLILRQWCKLMKDPKSNSNVPKLLLEPEESIKIPFYPTKGIDQRRKVKEIRKTMKSPLRAWSKMDQNRFIANAIPEFIVNPREKKFSLFVPTSFIEKIREYSMKNGSIWISENDVVTAVLFKLNLFRYTKGSQKPFTLGFTMNMRGFMPGYPTAKGEPDQVWLGNSNIPAVLPTHTVTEWRSKSIVEIAQFIRSTILAQRQPDQMALTCMMARESASRGTYPGYHPPDHKSFYCTSWEAANLENLYFSTKEDAQSTSSTSIYHPGQVLRVSGTSLSPNTPHRTYGVIINSQEQWYQSDTKQELKSMQGFWCAIAAREGLIHRINEWLNETLWSDQNHGNHLNLTSI